MSAEHLRHILFKWDFGTASITAVILTIVFVAYRTIFPVAPPLYDETGYALAYRNIDSTTVEYDRYFKIRYDFTGTVHRVVECPEQRSYDVPAVTRKFTAGSHHTQRTFAMEFKFRPDQVCVMRTWIEHHPLGSLRSHTYELQKVEFKILRGRDD